MKLRSWLETENKDILEAAKSFGVSIYAIKKWLSGDRTPRPQMQAKIMKITKGKVDGNSWIKE